MNDKVNVNPDEFIEIETKERIFARMCQILDKSNGKVEIPFLEYDSIEADILRTKFLDEAPDFFTEDTKQRIILMRIMEAFTKEEETSMEDLIGAVINPALCKGKTITTKEDVDSSLLTIELTGSH